MTLASAPATGTPHLLAFQTIAHSLAGLDSWEARYRYVIELGKALPKLADSEKTEAAKIHGCASQVWLVTEIDISAGQHEIIYRGESNALIVQGLIAILLALYSGRSAMEIVRIDALDLLDQIGLREHLTVQRANGLVAMVSRIRSDAAMLIDRVAGNASSAGNSPAAAGPARAPEGLAFRLCR